MDCAWTLPCDDEDLIRACQRFQICIYEQPEIFSYTSFKSILQEGPQCGLIAIAMYCNFLTIEKINQLFKLAKELNFTYNGEMFSAENLCTLTQMNTSKKVSLYSGNLNNEKIINALINKAVMLVPYDADVNHSPCSKNGHKAHWALILGIIKCNDNQIYVFARQGKSRHLGVWLLSDLAASNLQLNEVSPTRKESNLEYKIPEGGIAGPKGLKGKCVIIYNEENPDRKFSTTDL